MKNKACSRRKFISTCLGSGSILLGSAFIAISCHSNNPPSPENKSGAAITDCNDVSGVSAGEMEKRKKFAYVDKSMLSESRCGNCSMFIPQQQNNECGGCLLFAGPVKTTGYCIQFAAKV